MKISYKLTGVFLAIYCLLAGIGFLNGSLNSEVKNTTKRIVKHKIQETKSHIRLNNNLQKFRFELLKIWTLKQANAPIDTEKQAIDRSLNAILEGASKKVKIHQKSLQDLQDKPNQNQQDIVRIKNLKQEIPRIEKFKANLIRYKLKIASYFQLLDSDRVREAHQLFTTELEPYLNQQIDGSLQQDSEDSLKVLNEKTNLMLAEIKANQNAIYSSTFLALVISLLLGKYLSRSITKPLSELKEAALQIGKGHLNYQVNIKKQDEIGQLAECFSLMVTGLKNSTVSKFYLDRILASIIDSVITIDLNGTIQQVNPATCHLLGYSQSELLQQKLDKILDPSSLAIDKLIREGFLENYQTNYVTKSGIKIPVIFSSSFIQNKNQTNCGIVCIAKDVTTKYAEEIKLKTSEERYALASLATNEGLWDWQINSNQIYYSLRWKYLLGYEDSEIQANIEEWFSRIHPHDLDLVRQAINNNDTQFQIKYRIAHKDRSYRLMLCRGVKIKDDRGNIYRAVGSQTDITETIVTENIPAKELSTVLAQN